MSQLQSTVPGAIQAFYGLLSTAGAQQSTPVEVFVGSLNEREPNQYVMLGDTPTGRKLVQNHRLDVAALGSGALYENYELWGFVTSWHGGWDVVSRISEAWATFQAVVMGTYINYWGGTGSLGGIGSPVLGSSAPAALEEIVPITAEDISGPLPENAGYAGSVEFGFSLKARLTIP